MFKSIELGLKVSKEDFKKQIPKLRAELLKAQTELKELRIPVIVVVSGVEGAGKADVVNALTEWLDPRGVEATAFWSPSDEERARPAFWRYWRALPPRGKIGILFGSWYTDPIVDRVQGKSKTNAYTLGLERIAAFERMLALDGALIIKFWFHLSKDAQKQRLKKLQKDPNTRWRVTRLDWKYHKAYDKFVEVSEQAVKATDTAEAPWYLIDAEDRRYRDLEVARLLHEALRRRIDGAKQPPAPAKTVVKDVSRPEKTVLDSVNLKQSLSDKEYDEKIEKYQARLNHLSWQALARGISTVAVFEGWDAAGKGGAIRRLTTAVDAKLYRVIPIAAPTDEEKAHHYLWRFWRHIPRAGRVTIYDRSWYGRVLVERVEGFAKPAEWMRAYQEINDFEEQLASRGMVVLKFWVHISQEEQLRRFKERQSIEYKRHKITDEDWRNRDKWTAYTTAVNEMVARTSTEEAPWILVPGNDKKFARVEVIKTVCKHLEKAL